MLKTSNIDYITTIPRHSVAVVFLWFGLDKFINFQYYLSWFSATQSIKMLLPFSTDLSIHILGIVEIAVCILLFLGIKTRVLSIVVIVFLMTILVSAKYPSSFPQDIGIIGIAMMTFLASTSVDARKKFLKYSWISRYSMATVLFIWAIDYLVNYQRHEGWLHLASTFFSRFDPNNLLNVIIPVAIIEIILAALIVWNPTKTKYLPLVLIAFFLFAIFGLDMPANNHQSLGFIMISGWFLATSFHKGGFESVKK